MTRQTCPSGSSQPHRLGSLPALCTLCAVVWAYKADPTTRHRKRNATPTREYPPVCGIGADL